MKNMWAKSLFFRKTFRIGFWKEEKKIETTSAS